MMRQARGGQAPQGGMLRMPEEAQPLAQQPTDVADPMIAWGDEPSNPRDTWFL